MKMFFSFNILYKKQTYETYHYAFHSKYHMKMHYTYNLDEAVLLVVLDYCVVEMLAQMVEVQEVKEEVQNHHPRTLEFQVLVVADVTAFLDCCPVAVAVVVVVDAAAAAVASAVE